VPTLVVMGEKDPDFPDPLGEARWIAQQLHGRVEMVADAGHYPHAQRPDVVNASLIDFLRDVTSRG
jgi:pimeloyl-ACP methyl ester carboxylesterase